MPIEAIVWVSCAFGAALLFFFGMLFGIGLMRNEYKAEDSPDTEDDKFERETRQRRQEAEREAFDMLRGYDADVAYGVRSPNEKTTY